MSCFLEGISEALVNTAGGLAIGIPAMFFYAFFRGKSQKLISELESATTHVLALLSIAIREANRAHTGPDRRRTLISDFLSS